MEITVMLLSTMAELLHTQALMKTSDGLLLILLIVKGTYCNCCSFLVTYVLFQFGSSY